MKISRIQIDGILGIARVDIKPKAAIQLFAGLNGSGKSSIRDSIALAIGQETARDVTLKKEYGALVHDGAEQGGAMITVDDDIDKTFAFNMPKGKFDGMEITEPMRVALNGQRFSAMKPDERRTFLLELTKSKASAELVKTRMLERKCDPKKIEAVLPLARAGGFPVMCEHAKEKAKESKTAWRVVTGEVWGSDKAPKWSATMPDAPDDGAATPLRATVEDLDGRIAAMNEQLGTIKETARKAEENATRRAALEASVKKVPDLVDQLERAKKELADYLPKVEALRARAGGTARIGLIHDMATYINAIYENSTDDEDAAFELVKRYQAEHGPLGAKSDPEAQAALPEHESGLKVMQNRVKNLERDVDSAKQAKGQYDALQPDGEAVDVSADIAEVDGLIAAAKADRTKAMNALLDIEAAIKNRSDAEKKTKDAAAHHADVMAWSLVADAVAPDGIPAELLAKALSPVNDALDQAAVDTDWMQIKIGPDMDITAAGRPYRLLSESEQWRSDAMIAQVVSEISGLKVLMLDRMDVLDLPGRAQLLSWLDMLATNDLMDTALLFATLKESPKKLADTVEVHWVENGEISGAEQRAAA